jgi:hypothetical protein
MAFFGGGLHIGTVEVDQYDRQQHHCYSVCPSAKAFHTFCFSL